MPISLSCPSCDAKLKAPDAAAGRTLTCPGCLTPVQIPGQPASTTKRTPPTRTAPTPKKTTPPPKAAEEIYQDFEVVEDDADDIDEVIPVSEEEEGVDELEEVPDKIDELEEVPAEEDLETVLPVEQESSLAWSRILKLSVIHVRGHDRSFGESYINNLTRQDHRGYDVCDPRSGKRLGDAVEVRDTQAQVARLLVGRTLMTAHLEIREGRNDDLLATIRRPPFLVGSTLEVVDPEDGVIGKFESSPWSALAQKPMWITSKRGKKLLKVKPELSRWRLAFQTAQGKEVGEMISEAAYEGGGMKIHWFAKGMSFYLRFRPELDDRPRDKLLFMAVSLGMDL